MLLVLNYVFLSIGVVVALWGSRRIADRLEVLRAETPPVLGTNASRVFGTINNVTFPLLASVAFAVAFGAAALVWLVPVVLTGLSDVVGAIVGLAVVAVGLGFFFLSMLGLHRQMTEVKARELLIARDLYAQAYQPVWRTPTLEALEQQQKVLGAADALEQRAKAIQVWPVDDKTFAWVIGIATSVIAASIARLILAALGL